MSEVGQTQGISRAKEGHSTTAKSYNQKEWLENQWKKGATVWTIPHIDVATGSASTRI